MRSSHNFNSNTISKHSPKHNSKQHQTISKWQYTEAKNPSPASRQKQYWRLWRRRVYRRQLTTTLWWNMLMPHLQSEEDNSEEGPRLPWWCSWIAQLPQKSFKGNWKSETNKLRVPPWLVARLKFRLPRLSFQKRKVESCKNHHHLTGWWRRQGRQCWSMNLMESVHVKCTFDLAKVIAS